MTSALLAPESQNQRDKRLYSVKEFGGLYGLGTTSIYGLLRTGALRAVKVGGLTKIRREDAEEWASSLKLRSI
jgi:excisionase family DNA binding protein